MVISTNDKYLPVYEALASRVRLKIIDLISKKPMNIKELAAATGLTSAIITMHIKKLEDAQIIDTKRERKDGAVHKICSISIKSIEIVFPEEEKPRNCHTSIISVGHYTDFSIKPTCGLATEHKQIGNFDDTRAFLETDRVNAKILWFYQGFIEYKVPNYLLSDQEPEELEISFEISSEAPGINENWPSDISFFLNGVYLGYWTSPGDFGEVKGKLTPPWWNRYVNQYGVLKLIRINNQGTFVDGNKISDTTLAQVSIRNNMWIFRISVLEDSEHVGGVTLFGDKFGNYAQDIVFKLYYDSNAKNNCTKK